MNAARKHKNESGGKAKKSKGNLFIVAKNAKNNKKKEVEKGEKKSNLFVVKKDKKGKKGKKKEKNADQAKEAPKEEFVVIHTVTDPKRDKAFQGTIKHINTSKEAQKTHAPAADKVEEIKKAAVLTIPEQQKKNDQGADFETIQSTSAKAKKLVFTPATFKKLLQKDLDKLEDNLPNSEAGAKRFKRDKPLDDVKDNVSANVGAEKDSIAGPLATSTKGVGAPASNGATVEAVVIPENAVGVAPKAINKKASVPKKKHKTEISMEKESKSLDTVMEENEVTDEQLSKSNEPKFTEALDSKNDAKTELKKAPLTYRSRERNILSGAREQAGVSGHEGLHGMFASRLGAFGAVMGKQTTTQNTDKEEQIRINAEFTKIYDNTKDEVTIKLDGITDDVDAFFEEGAAVDRAKNTFENNVEKQLGEIYGWFTIDDWLFGADTEAIEKVFVREKKKFISSLDGIFDKIARVISTGLNGAITIIDKGRKATKTFYDGLDKKQQGLAKDALEAFNDKYNDLEEEVSSKEEELAGDLAKKYKENVDSLRETFDKIKEEVSATWLSAAFNFIKGVIETILKIVELLTNLLAAIVSAIKAIIADPVGFLKNLFAGIKLGFENFFANIRTHLITALIEWLTGSLGGVGITMPKNLFSLSGIFNLVMQILGLSWDYFRAKAVKTLGEPVVAGIEKAVEVFQIIKEKGITGLWDFIKEQFTDLKAMVMDAIRDMIITKVVQAGIKWIMGLMSPAGAFVKAAMLIIDVVTFFVERAAQIAELVTAFMNSVRALAEGNIAGVAKGIEKALAKVLPILIGFLAALVGVTGLTGKVQKIIKRVRKRIDKAIDKVIKKAKKTFKKLVKKGKAKVKGAVGKLLQWWKKKKGFKTEDGKNHTIYFKGTGKNAKLIRASIAPTELSVFLKSLKIKSNDPRYKKVQEAERLEKELKLITRTSKTGKNTDSKKEKDITNSMTKLSKVLVSLISGSVASTPSAAEWLYTPGDKKRARVNKLSHKTAKGGSGASGKSPEMDFVAGQPWVRMHLLANSIGGQGTEKNWVPAPSNTNTSGAVLHSFEASAERLVRSDAIPASAGVRAKSSQDKTPNVIWMDIQVLSNHPKGSDTGGYTGFADKMLFQYGIYLPPEPGKKDWTKVANPLSTQSISVEKPPSGVHVVNLSSPTLSRNEMRLTRNKHFTDGVYGERLLAYIKAAKPYGTYNSLESKLKAKNAASPSSKRVMNDALITQIVSDLQSDAKIKIK